MDKRPIAKKEKKGFEKTTELKNNKNKLAITGH